MSTTDTKQARQLPLTDLEPRYLAPTPIPAKLPTTEALEAPLQQRLGFGYGVAARG